MEKQESFDNRVSYYKDGLNEFVAMYVPFQKKVLDVGCSEGRLGQYLRKEKKCVVVGVEISPKALKKAGRRLDEVYLIDVERDEFPFPRRSFDVIICADVLEHLYNPLAVIMKLKPYLKKKGFFIFSVPNIANVRIRWNLLWGRFDYQKEGILDESHIRFFTRKTFFDLIEQAGLKVDALSYSPGFSFFFLTGRVLKLPFLRYLLGFLTRSAPTLFCRQFIVVAKL